MLKSPNLEKIEKRILLLISILLLVALYLNLGIYPLMLEEPRRGLIALEMLFSENWLVPTQNGELYFRKPPVYNWLLIFSYKLFGTYSEFATRFFSVASFIGMGVVFFRFCKKHLNERIAAYSALFFMVSVDILFYFSALGEIDLFYSLITLMVFIVIYNYGEKQRYNSLFISAYSLSAIGFLTKGIPSVAFLGISFLVYFVYTKQFKKLFSLPHLIGAVAFIIIVGGYFWGYSQYEDPSGWWSTLTSESTERTTKTGVLGFLKHLLIFPLDTLKNILPLALFLPLLFHKGLIQSIKKNPFVLYLALIFIANIIIYWLSTGARSRYIYAIYPMLIGVIVYVINTSEFTWRDRIVKVIAIFLASVTVLANASLYFIPNLDLVDDLLLKSVILTICAGVLFAVVLKVPKYRLAMIIACFMILRFDFSLIMPVSRAKTSNAAIDKVDGLEIGAITKGKKLAIFSSTQISRTTIFYIEATRENILNRSSDLSKDGFWICTPQDTLNQNFVVLKAFQYRKSNVLLVK